MNRPVKVFWSNCPSSSSLLFAVGGQDEERRQQGLGEQPGRRGGQPARPCGGRARTDGHQWRLHPQVRGLRFKMD